MEDEQRENESQQIEVERDGGDRWRTSALDQMR